MEHEMKKQRYLEFKRELDGSVRVGLFVECPNTDDAERCSEADVLVGFSFWCMRPAKLGRGKVQTATQKATWSRGLRTLRPAG